MSIFTKIFDTAVGLYKNISGGAKISQILGSIYSNLDEIIISIVQVGGANSETRVREAWQEFRNRTGTDLQAYDVFKDIPQEIEEKMFNGLADFGEEMNLYFIGHYGNRPSEEEFRAVMKSIPFAEMLKPAETAQPAQPETETETETVDERKTETSSSVIDVKTMALVNQTKTNPELLSMDLKVKALATAIIQINDFVSKG